MMVSAPATTAAITADSPTAPAPNTTSDDPGCTSRATSTDPAPVCTPHPSGPSFSIGRSGSTLTVFRSLAMQWVANEDWANQRDETAAPSASVTPVDPSRPRPVRLRNSMVWQ